MKKTYWQVLAIVFLVFVQMSYAEDAQMRKCPEFVPNGVTNIWRLGSPALNCRSACVGNSDCTTIKDNCGRRLFINKSFSSEVETILKKTNYACQNQLEVADEVGVECRQKHCAPVFKSCEVEMKKQDNFIAENVDTNCSSDTNCTFFLAPQFKCVSRIAASKSNNFIKAELNFGFMREAVLTACNLNKPKECDSIEKPFCVSKQCLMFKEKPPFKNFVNLEGAAYKLNFQSNTTPIKMPPAKHSKCQVDSDCTEVAGICNQYFVSLNKKFQSELKTEIQKASATIACPDSPKLEVVKSRCFKEFCSFVN